MLPGSSSTKETTLVNHHSRVFMEINKYLYMLLMVKVNSDISAEARLSVLFHRSGEGNYNLNTEKIYSLVGKPRQ